MVSRKITTINQVLFFLLASLNLLLVFTPELGFDALWYHLTLPKLWLLKHQWFYPGGLLYYSGMPRLTETIFIPLIKVSGFIGPKFIQYLSGLWISFLLYRLANKLIKSTTLSWVTINLFYLTWVVSWQSSSAYIDLFRTALEFSAIYFLLTTKKTFIPGILVGLAIGTKYHSLLNLFLLIVAFRKPKIIIPAFLLSLPWFLIAYYFTHNPLYPLFTTYSYQGQLSSIPQNFYQPTQILSRLCLTWLHLTFPFDDFISPAIGLVFLFSLPQVISRSSQLRSLAVYSLSGIFITQLIPPPSSRYLLPYLPSLIICSLVSLNKLKLVFQRYFIYFFIFSSAFIFLARLYNFSKYLPFLLGRQTTNQFLVSQNRRLPLTFIDSDNYVLNNLKGKKILIDKLHNLYYFPYDFDHTSWVSNYSTYDYLITQNTNPETISGKLIHTNSLGIQVYSLK